MPLFIKSNDAPPQKIVAIPYRDRKFCQILCRTGTAPAMFIKLKPLRKIPAQEQKRSLVVFDMRRVRAYCQGGIKTV
jgi:hypothetical protein